MPATYEFPRPALTVDCVVFGFDGRKLRILLIKRALPPFRGKWALPGGFVRVDESVDDAARRELAEEAGLRDVYLEQLYTFGEPKRDPRERVVTVAYFALVKLLDHAAQAATDALAAEWFEVDGGLPALAFDHARIIETARTRLRAKVRYQPVGFELLPPRFILSQLQSLYEAVLGRELDKRNFRKKLFSLDVVTALDEWKREGRGRPAQLFAFDRGRYDALVAKGIDFEL